MAKPHPRPNLANRALVLCTARLAALCPSVGYHLVAVESFVNGEQFRGTAYKATGWQRLGISLQKD